MAGPASSVVQTLHQQSRWSESDVSIDSFSGSASLEFRRFRVQPLLLFGEHKLKLELALPENYSNPSAPLDTGKYLSRKGAKIAKKTVGNAAAHGAFAALREKILST